jgi:hypothetical protein
MFQVNLQLAKEYPESPVQFQEDRGGLSFKVFKAPSLLFGINLKSSFSIVVLHALEVMI